ncbi:MAG: hypothetical protein EU532_02245 [Promethearchaeota archaeon]|nr:MAG: hypothetical protein EU532_02245 [Candidatus Lokiarchaeota archaeon]
MLKNVFQIKNLKIKRKNSPARIFDKREIHLLFEPWFPASKPNTFEDTGFKAPFAVGWMYQSTDAWPLHHRALIRIE